MTDLGFIIFIIILLFVYFIIPFTVLLIILPKIKKARKNSKDTYSSINCNPSSSEHLYFIDMPRQDIIEILSVHDVYSDFSPAVMQLTLRDSSSESIYHITIEEIEGGCIVKALLLGRSYRNTSHMKLNSFFKERLGAKGYSHEEYYRNPSHPKEE